MQLRAIAALGLTGALSIGMLALSAGDAHAIFGKKKKQVAEPAASQETYDYGHSPQTTKSAPEPAVKKTTAKKKTGTGVKKTGQRSTQKRSSPQY